MGSRNKSTAKGRTLWMIFAIGFATSLVGAAILFIPALEFLVVDLIEKLHLPAGLIANIALIADFALFAICGIGLITMAIRSLIFKRARTQAP
jgi:hypothetical protein